MKKLFAYFWSATLMLVSLFASALPVGAVGMNDGTGSLTITNGQSGTQYAAYQIFSASYTDDPALGQTQGVTYFADEQTKDFFDNLKTNNQYSNPFLFTPSADNLYEVTVREGYPEDSVVQFFNYYRSDIEKQFASTKHEPTSVNGNIVQFADIPYGYYYVTSSSGALVSLSTAAPNAQVIEKTQRPVIDEDAKKVKVGDSWQNWSGTTVGDIRDFKIQFSASNYIDETPIPSYTINDKSTNLKVDETTLVLTIGDLQIPFDQFADHKIQFSNAGNTMTLVIPWADETGQPLYRPAPTDVTLTYQAQVQKEAAVSGASNVAEIVYNDQSVYSSVNLACYSFKLNKYDKESADNGAPVGLNGAKFTLWDAAQNGNQIYVESNANGGYNVIGKAEADKNDTLIEAGMTQIYGLNAGTYYLQEETAPDGYNKLASRVEVTIVKPASGQGENVVDVLNAKGTMLPSTGANGNFAIYLTAALLSAAAIVLLVIKNRKTGKQN